MKIEVKQDEQNPIAAEVIAQSIVDIANAMKAINASRLNRRALVTLLHDSSKVPRRDIEFVLNHLAALEQVFLKPAKAK